MNGELSSQCPVYSTINHPRSSNVHDYVDIDGNSTLESTKTHKTDYCPMDPQAPPLLSPLPRHHSRSFSTHQRPADKSVKRSISIGPVSDIYSYRKQRKKSEHVSSYENYMRNRILPGDLAEENMYGSWCSSSHKALLGSKCNGACSQISENSRSRKELEENGDQSSFVKHSLFSIRSCMTIGIFIITIVAVSILIVKVLEKYDEQADMNVADIKAIFDLVSSPGGLENSDDKELTAPNVGDEEYFGPNKPNKATGQNKNKCCKNIRISSTGLVAQTYPFLLGIYRNKEPNNSSPVYKKDNENRFLSRPYGFTKSGTHTYGWGVNSSPDAKWGWIKSFSRGTCPHNIWKWKVFNGNINKWISDKTLNITCYWAL